MDSRRLSKQSRNKIIPMKNYCRICLALNVRLLKLGDTYQSRFMGDVFRRHGYYQLLNKNDDVCFICNALMLKSYNFVVHALRAQQVFDDLLKKHKLVQAINMLEYIDRRKLNCTNLSYKTINIGSVDEHESMPSIKKEINNDIIDPIYNIYVNNENDPNDNMDSVKPDEYCRAEMNKRQNRTDMKEIEIKLGEPCIDFGFDMTDANDPLNIVRNGYNALDIDIEENDALATVTEGGDAIETLSEEISALKTLTELKHASNSIPEAKIEFDITTRGNNALDITFEANDALDTDRNAALDTITDGNAALDTITEENAAFNTITEGNYALDIKIERIDAQDIKTEENAALDNIPEGNAALDTITEGYAALDTITEGYDALNTVPKQVDANDITTKENGPLCIDITKDNDDFNNVINNSFESNIPQYNNNGQLMYNKQYKSLKSHNKGKKAKTMEILTIILDSDSDNKVEDVKIIKQKKKKKTQEEKDWLESEREAKMKRRKRIIENRDKVKTIRKKHTKYQDPPKLKVDNTNIVEGKRTIKMADKRKIADYDEENSDGDEDNADDEEKSDNKKEDDDYAPDSDSETDESEGPLEYPTTCECCDALLSSKLEHFHHYLECHPKIKYPHRHSGFLHICEICGTRIYYKGHVNSHMMKHGDKTIKCTECSKMYHTTGQLKQHMKIVHGPKKFQCDHCGKRFPEKGAIRLHIRTHTGQKPYKCHICNAGFAHNGNRLLHIRVKHQNLPYPSQEKHEKLNQEKQTKKKRKPRKINSSDDDDSLATLSERKKIKNKTKKIKNKSRKQLNTISESEL